ncbi:MAG: glycosyltransferase family 2 protein [Deltaproteobacteria bacterium]|nr:glycosyltransferase family 2 protein [Deltaproteobacteria bacterium]
MFAQLLNEVTGGKHKQCSAWPRDRSMALSEQPRIAVIVLNWNGFDDTAACLESLRRLDYHNFKTVLVDNGSANNEAARLSGLFPEVYLIANTENRGFAGGNNDGIGWALANGCDYIVNLNNDCLVEPDWLSNLISGVLTTGADFASSRIMRYPQTDRICSDGDGLLPDGAGFVLREMQTWDGSREPCRIISACGAASLYSADCVRRVSLACGQFFDELYFAYYEDIDLGFRLHAKNCRGVCVPDAVVYHKGQQSTGEHSFFIRFHSEKNRRLNVRLNFPLWLQPISPIYRIARNIYRGDIINFEKHIGKKTTVPNSDPDLNKAVRDWMKNNAAAIACDRSLRKAAGLISSRAYAAITWNPFKYPTPRADRK